MNRPIENICNFFFWEVMVPKKDKIGFKSTVQVIGSEMIQQTGNVPPL